MALHTRARKRFRAFLRITSILCLSHPAITMFYFVCELIILFLFNNPIFLLTSLILVIVQLSYMIGLLKVMSLLKNSLPFVALIAILNPIFNRRGATILFYLLEKPVTLEAFAYGTYMAVLILTMLLVFSLMNNVLGTSKLLYLFSKRLPQISFMVSMTLRYSEFLKTEASQYLTVQKTRELSSKKTNIQKIKNAGEILAGFSSSVLENVMTISETLKSKQYGERKRTLFLKFSFTKVDLTLMIFCFLNFLFIIAGTFKNLGTIDYYRNLSLKLKNIEELKIFIAFSLFFLLPLIIDGIYKIKFRMLQCYNVT